MEYYPAKQDAIWEYLDACHSFKFIIFVLDLRCSIGVLLIESFFYLLRKSYIWMEPEGIC